MEEEKGADADSGLCRGPARVGKASFPRDLGPPRHSSTSPLVPLASHSFCQVSSYPLKLPDPQCPDWLWSLPALGKCLFHESCPK